MVVRLSAQSTGRALRPINIFLLLVLIPVRGCEPQGLVRPEGLGTLKSFTSWGLEPATFQLVA
jgi:hypothetical protein